MRRSCLIFGLFCSGLVLLAATAARAQDGAAPSGGQVYPVPYVDRPLTLASLTLSPDVTFDATQAVQDPDSIQRTFQTNLAFAAGAAFGITDDLEIRGSVGTIRVSPKFTYTEPRVGATFRFVGAEKFNMGVHAEATALTLPGEGGVRLEASLPMLIRLGSAARIDLAPGAPVTIQEKKATTFGLTIPFALAFQTVEILHLGVRTSATITDFSNPGENLVIPLGFFAGISIGSERPFVEINPYFTWTEFSKPGAKFNNDKLSIDKFSAGLTGRFYFFL